MENILKVEGGQVVDERTGKVIALIGICHIVCQRLQQCNTALSGCLDTKLVGIELTE